MGAGRTEVRGRSSARTRSTRGKIRCAAGEIRIANPAGAARHRIGYLSEDRKQLGLMLEQEVSDNIALADPRPVQSGGCVKARAMRRPPAR